MERKHVIALLRKAPKRFRKSFGYSWNGLKATFQKEESFRLECIGFAVTLAALCLSSWPLWKHLVLIGSYFLILLVEVVNSAIEDICDGITRDYSLFIMNAKDKGALAVLMAIVINAFTLATLLIV